MEMAVPESGRARIYAMILACQHLQISPLEHGMQAGPAALLQALSDLNRGQSTASTVTKTSSPLLSFMSHAGGLSGLSELGGGIGGLVGAKRQRTGVRLSPGMHMPDVCCSPVRAPDRNTHPCHAGASRKRH